MRAVTYNSFGPAAEVLAVKEIPTPTPQAGEVLVRLATSGVNPSDCRARAGGRPGVTQPPYPLIVPHSDGAGVIEAVGAGVKEERVGERVWIWNGQWRRAFGTAAEYIALPEDQAVRLPDATTFEEGAVLGIPGLTAVHTVLGAGPVADKKVLISGGAGTVGHIAVQIASLSGAQVLTTAHGQQKMETAKAAGADAVFDYDAPDLADQILEAAGGPVDLIVEVEFGRNIDTNTAVIAERGRIVTYGSARSMTPTLPFYPLLFKAVTIDIALIYLLTPMDRLSAISNLMALLERRVLELRISKLLDLADCAKAHEIIESGARAGAVVLKV